MIPFDDVSEQRIIVTCCLDPSVCPTVKESLSVEDFVGAKNRDIFKTICKLVESGEQIDLAAVGVGSGHAVYVSELLDTVEIAISIENEIKKIKMATAKRKTIQVLNRAVTDAKQNDVDISDLLEQLEAATQDAAPHNWTGIGDLVCQQCDYADEITDHPEKLRGVKTGIKKLDFMGGLQPSDLIILAARPSMGKTALMMTMAAGAAKYGNVAVFSLEMSKAQLANRMIASEARINTRSFLSGGFSVDEFRKMHQASAVLYDRKIFIDDTAALHIGEIIRRAMALHRRKPLLAVMVDYLQLARGSNANRALEIGEISSGLKFLAKRLDVPVVALSQLNRGLEERTNKRPRLSDLRDSGTLEQDADVVMSLYRDEVYDPESKDRGLADLEIIKGRNMGTGFVRLKWHSEWTRFDNYEGE